MSDKPESSKTRLEEHLIQPLFQKDFLSELPEEVAYRIIAYLTPCDLTVCAGVSRTWQRICEDEWTWRQKCWEKGYVKFDAPSFCFLGGWARNRANERAGITIFSHMDFHEAHQNRREREIAYGQCYERSSWKSLYLRKKRIISNWRSRPIQSSTVLKDRDEHVVTCLQIHSGRIVAGYHHALRVWNVDDAQPVFTVTGQMGVVKTSQVSDDGKYIVSGSSDKMVRVWCGQTGAQLHVLQGHTREVWCMSLHGTTLVSGSCDETLRVWDIVDGKCLHILTGHFGLAWCVQFDGIRVVVPAGDFTVKVWNVQTGECLHTLTGHTDSVESLLFDPERDLVVSGSLDGTIRVWDIRGGTCIAIFLSEGIAWGSGMQLRGNILVGCYANSNVGVWDIRDGGSCIHRLQGLNGHTSPITSFQWLDSGLLVTACYDGLVKLWDVDKGIFVRDLVRLESGGGIWRLRAAETLLVCAVKSQKGFADRKLILIDFDASYP